MRSRLFSALLVLIVGCCLIAPASLAGKEGEPSYVTVQHLLIGYKRSVPNKPKLDRTRREDARRRHRTFAHGAIIPSEGERWRASPAPSAWRPPRSPRSPPSG